MDNIVRQIFRPINTSLPAMAVFTNVSYIVYSNHFHLNQATIVLINQSPFPEYITTKLNTSPHDSIATSNFIRSFFTAFDDICDQIESAKEKINTKTFYSKHKSFGNQDARLPARKTPKDR